MPSEGYILGLSALAHDPAAALLDPGGKIIAIEESKLARTRETMGIPREAIRYCFERAGISWRDVSSIAVASEPRKAWRRSTGLRLRQVPRAPVASGYYLSKSVGELGRELNNFRILDGMAGDPPGRVIANSHHVCHAASAFFASPFDRALVLVMDEQGDGRSTLAAIGEGTNLRVINQLSFPHSLAWVYSQVTELLGLTPHKDEQKLQWLSLFGAPEYEDMFLEMLRRESSPWPNLNRRYFTRGFTGRLAFSDLFYHQIGISKPAERITNETLRANLAASIQAACAKVVVDLLESLRSADEIEHLCLAGGLFLNPLLVSAIERGTKFKDVFVQPAAGNEGTAPGAAWNEWHGRLGRKRVAPMTHLYWGPAYSNDDIKQVLDNCKASYRWANSDAEKIQAALRLLSAGKIVAWCQGAVEFGPRALGNRSLLASPWAPFVKENLNDYVKHRESFRPFALAVPAEDSARFFESTRAARFMASMGVVKPEARGLLKDFILPGNLVRLHVVERTANPLFWQLLKQSGENTPAPLLVNTSFNLFGEPLVITPRDAVRSYFCSGTDALVIGNFILSKS
ncbi:MAG: carbamoyltransferase N-terminal domain-containing protein [Candidatus Acidiferrales bacterium]